MSTLSRTETIPLPAEEPGSSVLGQPPQPTGWSARLFKAENAVVSLALAVMVVVPLAEATLRRLFHAYIPASTAIVQHMVLVVGMLGGAVAAREQRLLTLSNVADSSLRGRWKRLSRILCGAVAAVVSGFLCAASLQFVQVQRQSGDLLGYGIPIWLVQCVMPLGFAVIALRVWWHCSESWSGRASGLALVAAFALAIWKMTAGGHASSAILFVILGVASILGLPAFVTLAGVALALFWNSGQPMAAIPIAHYALVTNPTLPTLPLFTLAGYFLAEGRAPERLVRVFYSLCGQFRGGPALVTVLVCAFFTSFTGASGVTILALGGLLMPVLTGARYSEKNALGLLTGAGSLGLLLPPCLPLIVYAIVAGVSIERMFLGGLVPAFVMIAATALWGIRKGSRDAASTVPFSWPKARAALWEAKWELSVPIVACLALFSGFATPVEAAAVTALYTFFTQVVIHRDLKLFGGLSRVMAECGLLIGGVLLILGISLGFTNYLVDAEVPAKAVEWTTHTLHSPFLFLLLLNVFLLVVGCLMEIYPAIVVEVPLLVPLGAAYGIDPVRLGIIFLANMELGYLTPPVGLNLLMSSYRFRKPVPEVLRATLPVVAVLAVGVLLITYIPALTTALPSWFHR